VVFTLFGVDIEYMKKKKKKKIDFKSVELLLKNAFSIYSNYNTCRLTDVAQYHYTKKQAYFLTVMNEQLVFECNGTVQQL
jgi:hypothetical protein